MQNLISEFNLCLSIYIPNGKNKKDHSRIYFKQEYIFYTFFSWSWQTTPIFMGMFSLMLKGEDSIHAKRHTNTPIKKTFFKVQLVILLYPLQFKVYSRFHLFGLLICKMGTYNWQISFSLTSKCILTHPSFLRKNMYKYYTGCLNSNCIIKLVP